MSTVAGYLGSMEVRGSDTVVAELREALVAWETGRGTAVLRRNLLRLLSRLEDECHR
jgi:hypothetical protein